MVNVKYIVNFADNSLLDDEFDLRDEALDWAKEHLDKKPIVKAVELEYNDYGEVVGVGEEEIIFNSEAPVEESKKFDSEDDKALSDLEKFCNDPGCEVNATMDLVDAAADEIPDEPIEEDLESEVSGILNSWEADPGDGVENDPDPFGLADSDVLADAEVVAMDEDLVVFDPFDVDFSECEPMEVCHDEHRADCCADFAKCPVDLLTDIAKDLGIEDQVEIKPAEDECEDCKDEISEISDEEEKEDEDPKEDPEDVVPEEVRENEKQNDLDEAAHPQEAQEEVDMVRSFNDALKIAKENNKPVIYGYFGPDHHGSSRYYKVDPVVCDDLAKCTADAMKKYHPNGSVLVAYPDKDFVEESLNEAGGLLHGLGQAFKGIGKGIAGAAKGVATAVAGKEAVNAGLLDKYADEHNGYFVNCIDKEGKVKPDQSKAFKTYKEAEAHAEKFSKLSDVKGLYIFFKDDLDAKKEYISKYVGGNLVKDGSLEKAIKKANDLKQDKKILGTDKPEEKPEEHDTGIGVTPTEEAKPEESAVENKPEEPKPEEKPEEVAQAQVAPQKRDMSKANNSRKLIKALRDFGLNADELVVKYTGKDGKEHSKLSDKALQLRKALFGESLEEDADIDDFMLSEIEDPEMTDEEFAEAFKKGLEEKHQEK